MKKLKKRNLLLGYLTNLFKTNNQTLNFDQIKISVSSHEKIRSAKGATQLAQAGPQAGSTKGW